jgi:hypothetical protein
VTIAGKQAAVRIVDGVADAIMGLDGEWVPLSADSPEEAGWL